MAVEALDYSLHHLAVTEELLDVVQHGLPTPVVTDALLGECVARIGTAIDTYFHVRVRKAIFSGGLSKAARNVTVPLGAVDDMVEHVVRNRDKMTRPRTHMVRAVLEKHRRQTFQGVRGVETAASLIPITKIWVSVAQEIADGSTAAEVENRIGELYRRRNIVVHEGAFDIGVAIRPRRLHGYRFDQAEVRRDLAWVQSFVEVVDRL